MLFKHVTFIHRTHFIISQFGWPRSKKHIKDSHQSERVCPLLLSVSVPFCLFISFLPVSVRFCPFLSISVRFCMFWFVWNFLFVSALLSSHIEIFSVSCMRKFLPSKSRCCQWNRPGFTGSVKHSEFSGNILHLMKFLACLKQIILKVSDIKIIYIRMSKYQFCLKPKLPLCLGENTDNIYNA